MKKTAHNIQRSNASSAMGQRFDLSPVLPRAGLKEPSEAAGWREFL